MKVGSSGDHVHATTVSQTSLMTGFMAGRVKGSMVEKLSSLCIFWYVASSKYNKYANPSCCITTSTNQSEIHFGACELYRKSSMHVNARQSTNKTRRNAMQECLNYVA
jgi:hypothetical protein